MRPAHLTKTNIAQIENSLNLLEQSFSKGNITRATYIQRKDDLNRLLNQSRTLNQSALAKDPAGFLSRNVVDHSAAPVGFLEAMGLKPKPTPQTYRETANQFWQPGNFLNNLGLKQGQKALNQQVAPAPALSENKANQMVNQGFNRASNQDIRKSLLEASNRETWSELDIQSVLNNQETSYKTSVNNAGLSGGGLGVALTNLPSYDRFSKNTMGTHQAEAVVFGFLQRVEELDFSKPNVLETIEGEARSAAISLYYAQVPTEDIQAILVNAITASSSKLLNNYEAMEAVNNGAGVMNQAKTGSESTLFNSFYNTFGPNQFVMNPSMSDPLKAIDLPTLYAMAEEAVGQEANKIQAEIVSRQDAMQATRRSSKTSRNQSNATGRGYNNAQAIKNRMATNKAFETSTAALQAQKADLMNVIDDILTIDGKMILDVQTGQFNAFVTETELKNAIMGVNYALAAEYWSTVERETLNTLYNTLTAQLEAMSGGTAASSQAPASAVSISINNAGQYNQSQQAPETFQLAVLNQLTPQQTNQQTVQQNLNQSANNSNSNNGNNGGLLNQVLNIVNQTNQTQQATEQTTQQAVQQNLNQTNQTNQFFQQEPPMPNPYSFMPEFDLKDAYGMMTQDLASDPNLENDAVFMEQLQFAEDEMVARGLLNSAGMQGAPRSLGFLSGSSTSTSSTSAHGDMRMHVARMNQADPRADLYEY